LQKVLDTAFEGRHTPVHCEAQERPVKNVECRISISRCSDGTIRISIEDKASNIQFFDGEMTPEAFGDAITGLSLQTVKAEVCSTENVGKKYVREARKVVLPVGLYQYDKEPVGPWIQESCKEEGWSINTYLGSRNSFSYDQATKLYTAHYSVFKYV